MPGNSQSLPFMKSSPTAARNICHLSQPLIVFKGGTKSRCVLPFILAFLPLLLSGVTILFPPLISRNLFRLKEGL